MALDCKHQSACNEYGHEVEHSPWRVWAVVAMGGCFWVVARGDCYGRQVEHSP